MSDKVLHICLSRGWGGLEMYPARLVAELDRQGWQTYALALADSQVAAAMAETTAQLVTVATPGQALRRILGLARWVRREGIAVIHCHKSSDLRIGALLKRFCPEVRLIFTDHMGVTRPKKDPYHRWGYGRVDRVLSISDTTLARNRRAFPLPAARIRRLYLGIDVDDLAPCLDDEARRRLRDELGLPHDALVVGLPGRLTPGKGQRVLLEAFARLCEAGDTSSRLVFIGGLGPDEGGNADYIAELQARVTELGLESRVVFTGFRRDLARLLEVLDVVCVPSRNEAFGLTVIEAMAAGKAVIGADSGAIPELIDDATGRLAEPTSAAVWAAALAELRDDAALRRRLGDTARARVRERFSLATHVAGLLRHYRGDDGKDAGES